MKNKLHGFTSIKLTDHQFAAYLHKKDNNWTHKHIIKGEISWTHFLNKDNKIIAVVKYKNSYPVDRWIWLPDNEAKNIKKKTK